MVADSDAETESASSMKDVHMITEHESREETVIHVTESDSKEDIAVVIANSGEHEVKEEIACESSALKSSEGGVFTGLRDKGADMRRKYEKIEEAEYGNADIIFSQDLIVRDSNLTASSTRFSADAPVLNFKRFRKVFWPN